MNDTLQSIVGDQPFQSIQLGETQVDVIGTAHVSAVSRDVVKALVAQGDYDGIGLELCEKRYATLKGTDVLAEMDMWQVIRQNKMFSVMASLLLSMYQRRIGQQFGVEPGGEFKAAINQAQQTNIPIALLDRDIGVSLTRFYRRLKWWHRPLLFSAFFASLFVSEDISEQDLEKLKKEGEFFNALSQLSIGGKELSGVLITERDEYMVAKIRQYIRKHSPARLLVVVGAGHLQGMVKILKGEEATPDSDHAVITAHSQIPPRVRWVKFLPWIITILILSGFVVGFQRDIELGLSLIGYWFLANGVLAALGALIAMAHPLTVVTAFLAAPLTSLNPLVGVGMATTAVQFIVRKPHVSDFATIKDDITHFGGWRRNRFAHLFLVFFLSSIGSVIGTYVGGIYIYNVLM